MATSYGTATQSLPPSEAFLPSDRLALPIEMLESLPVAAYICDRQGNLRGYNRRAAELWGRTPVCGDPAERYCGSYKLYLLDGTPLLHSECLFVDVLATGVPVRDQDVVIERPDGSRIAALVNINPLFDETGAIMGAINCFLDVSERKRAETELLANRNDLEDFFENAVVPMHWVDANGVIIRANRAEMELLGYGADEYIGRSVTDFHADKDFVANILERLCRGEKVDKLAARLLAKDGSIKHVLISSNAQFRNGALTHTRCVTLDVTDRERIEARLRDEQHLYRETLDALPVAIYTTDAQGCITYFNEAAVRFAGRTPQLGTDHWCVTWRLYHLDGSPMSHDECPMAVTLKEGRAVRGAKGYAERPDGTRVPFAPYPTPLFDESGKLVGAVNMLVDLSELNSLDELRQMLASIVQSSDDAIVSKSLNGVIMSWNAGAQRIFGYTADEVTGKPVEILIPLDRWHEESEILGRIRRGERVDHYETVRKRKDGTLITVSITVSPIRDAAGRIVGASKIARDITARKQAEERMQLLAREVDHRANNLLATIQAIVRLTRATSIEQYKSELEGRIGAISKAHRLVSEGQWGATDFRRLAAQEFAGYGLGEGGRIRLSGPEVSVSPRTGQSLALILHELATNSAKYGSLSAPDGTVTVAWSMEAAPAIKVVWTEAGGPAVKPPSTRGFGTGLIEAVVRNDFKGELSFDWRPEGLVFSFVIAHPSAASGDV